MLAPERYSTGMHSVSVEYREHAAIVSVAGEVDAFVAPELERALSATESRPFVVIDLARVSFLDSTALGVVVRATRALDELETAVRVILPRGTARRIFEITTLDRVLPIVGSREEALADLPT